MARWVNNPNVDKGRGEVGRILASKCM